MRKNVLFGQVEPFGDPSDFGQRRRILGMCKGVLRGKVILGVGIYHASRARSCDAIYRRSTDLGQIYHTSLRCLCKSAFFRRTGRTPSAFRPISEAASRYLLFEQ